MKQRNSAGLPLVPKVLITGATGFLGGYAVTEFLNQGFEVYAHGRNKSVLTTLEKLGAIPVPGDLAQLAVTHLHVDIVVHAAALSTPWGSWKDFDRTNVLGTEQVVQFMERNGVPRLVFVSSPSVYAQVGDHLGITEDQVDPKNKLNNYIRSKITAEALLHKAHEASRFPELVILRPRGLIGAGDTSVAPRLLSAYNKIGVPVFHGGQNLIDLTAVQNVAYALRLAAQVRKADGQVYNITNGDPQKFMDLLEILFDQLGIPPKYRRANPTAFYALAAIVEAVAKVLPGRPEPPLTRYTVTTIAYSQTLDISKAQNELGYRPQVTIAQALAAFAATYEMGANNG